MNSDCTFHLAHHHNNNCLHGLILDLSVVSSKGGGG